MLLTVERNSVLKYKLCTAPNILKDVTKGNEIFLKPNDVLLRNSLVKSWKKM